MLIIIAKFAYLTLGITFLSTNIARATYKQNIPFGNFLYMAIGLAGFIVLQFCR